VPPLRSAELLKTLADRALAVAASERAAAAAAAAAAAGRRADGEGGDALPPLIALAAGPSLFAATDAAVIAAPAHAQAVTAAAPLGDADAAAGTHGSAFVLPMPRARAEADVFLSGPLSYSSDLTGKGWSFRWAVLHRERLDLFTKFADSKPKLSVTLRGALLSVTEDPTSPASAHLTLTHGKGQKIWLRADAAAVAAPALGAPIRAPGPAPSGFAPPPDPLLTHRAWAFALKARIANGEYIRRCRLQSAPLDARVIRAFDCQVLAPAIAAVNKAHTPASTLTVALAPVPPHAVVALPGSELVHVASASAVGDLAARLAAAAGPGAAPEAFAALDRATWPDVHCLLLDLEGPALPLDAASTLGALLADRDATPVAALRLGRVPLDALAAECVFSALTAHPLASLREVSFDGARWLSATPEAPALLAGLLASPAQRRLQSLSLACADIGDGFLAALEAALAAAGGAQAPLLRLSLQGNPELGDAGAAALASLLGASKPLSDRLQLLRLDGTSVGDVGATALARWAQQPLPLSLTPTGAAPPPPPAYRHASTALAHFSLAGNAAVGPAAAVALARAFAWSPCLRTLDLARCSVGVEGAAALTHLAELSESLTALRFAHYSLSSEGLTALRLLHRFRAPDLELFDQARGRGRAHFTPAALCSDHPAPKH
jgi:hypothetical protein